MPEGTNWTRWTHVKTIMRLLESSGWSNEQLKYFAMGLLAAFELPPLEYEAGEFLSEFLARLNEETVNESAFEELRKLPREALLNAPTTELGLRHVTENLFLRVQTLGDLIEMSSRDLLDITNIGEVTVRKIREALKRLGLSLKDEP
jgi:DNA-directed RNA polymerase alpha subunit